MVKPCWYPFSITKLIGLQLKSYTITIVINISSLYQWSIKYFFFNFIKYLKIEHSSVPAFLFALAALTPVARVAGICIAVLSRVPRRHCQCICMAILLNEAAGDGNFRA